MLWPTLIALAGTLLLVARIVLAFRARDAAGNRTVAVAFAPPRALTPGTAATLRKEVLDETAVPAEILDLAVKGVWQVGVREEDGRKVWFVHRDTVHMPILDGVAVDVYRAVFPYGSTALTQDLTRDDRRARDFRAVVIRTRREARNAGWIEESRKVADVQLWTTLGFAAVAVGGIVWFITNGSTGGDVPPGYGLIGGGMLAGFVARYVPTRRRWLTAEGRRINDELDGLKLYMTMAEKDRLKVLQAPDTALRLPVRVDRGGGTIDRVQVAKLNERLLPWAVVFGILPEWSRALAADFEAAGLAPTWVFLPGGDLASGALTFGAFTDAGGFDTLSDVGSFADSSAEGGAGLAEIGSGSDGGFGGGSDAGGGFGGWGGFDGGGFGGDGGGGGGD